MVLFKTVWLSYFSWMSYEGTEKSGMVYNKKCCLIYNTFCCLIFLVFYLVGEQLSILYAAEISSNTFCAMPEVCYCLPKHFHDLYGMIYSAFNLRTKFLFFHHFICSA